MTCYETKLQLPEKIGESSRRGEKVRKDDSHTQGSRSYQSGGWWCCASTRSGGVPSGLEEDVESAQKRTNSEKEGGTCSGQWRWDGGEGRKREKNGPTAERKSDARIYRKHRAGDHGQPYYVTASPRKGKT